MTKADERAPADAARTGVDWRQIASATCTKIDWVSIAQQALGSAALAALVDGALHVIGKAIVADGYATTTDASADDAETIIDAEYEVVDEPPKMNATDARPQHETAAVASVDPDVVEAAQLLGVAVGASADEIRAALRSALASSRLHPDQGGDAERAKQLIAAKNLLVERARCQAA